jgi:probable F420-dependent oxidoreductase
MPAATPIRLGLALPHDVVGDRRALVSAAEDAGYRYLTIADHVVGAATANRPGWAGRYTAADPFREVFVHLGHLSALTTLELVPSIVVLPQRQAAVVAKQTAELALLSRGGVRLGVGAGWNQVEFEALGERFETRGARLEEQITVLRKLWSEPVVSFTGRYHRLDEVGIAPLPPEPVPIWLGGGLGTTQRARERVRRRIVALADGWICPPQLAPEDLPQAVAALRGCAREEGRDPASIGVQATLLVDAGDDEAALRAKAAHLRAAGAGHVTVDCRASGGSLSQHIDLSCAVAGLLDREF